MKQFIIAMIALLVVACTGDVDLGTQVQPDARVQYEQSGATGIHVYDVNAVNPVTVTGRVVGDTVGYTLGCGQFMYWDVSVIDPANYTFWLTQAITITYDADLFDCNTVYRCDYDGQTNPAVLNGSVWEAPVTCQVAP